MEFISHHRKTVRRNKCCVRGCESTTNKDTNLSFHAIPKSGVKITRINLFGTPEIVDKRAEWLKKLNIINCNRELTVCSKHFKMEDYCLADTEAKRRVLRKSAIPSFGNKVSQCKQREASNSKRAERCSNRNTVKQSFKEKSVSQKIEKQINAGIGDVAAASENTKFKNEKFVVDQSNIDRVLNDDSIINVEDANIVVIEPEHHDKDCEELQKEPDLLHIQSDTQDSTDNFCDSVETKNQEDKSIQVNTDNFVYTLSSFLKSESDLITWCNIKSFSILNELTKILDEIYPRKRMHLLSTRDSIIVTMAKLKLDIPFRALAVLFNSVTEVTIRNCFYDTVKKLSTILQSVIRRVSKEEILRNMPLCFEKFKATTSVLDCTEVNIQTPKCLKCKLKFFSHYKGHLTVKFMTEVTPAGLITFVSESFGGRASDKAIFNYSGTLRYMESTRDAVMVDRGFLIDDECLQKQIQLIRPPYIKNKEQFTEPEAKENKEIACARVHIERVNQRIKQFQILNHNFPLHMIDYVDDIFIICCSLANLDTPVLADDKF